MEVKVERNTNPQVKPDETKLGFGRYFTDHMFLMDYDEGQGWHDARVVPYGPIPMDPAAMVLHYAQEAFEGLKAYRNKDGEILLFRPEMNAKRLQKSNERLAMPKIEVEDFISAVKAVVKVDEDWVPHNVGTSLYIRPFIFATEKGVGVHAAKSYKFVIILSPVGAYYETGLDPVKIYVEDEYVRAVKGGTGFTKCGGNYASSIVAQAKAEKYGCEQVLWLDGVEHKYIEEVGAMNVMFLINKTVYTTPLNGSILAGVTRDSILTILRDWGYEVKEEALSVDALMKAGHDGSLKEVWGTGTAAVISPVGELYYKEDHVVINECKTGELSQRLYDELTGIQWGLKEDKFGWSHKLDE